MPLTLITGPANAAKAGWVLGAFRDALGRAARGSGPAPEPLLVVPTAADVEPYQRELALSGTVFGGRVATFSGLLREIAAAAGVTAKPLGAVATEQVVRAVVRETPLDVLADSADTQGFARAAERLFAELQRALVPPPRLTRALRAWTADARPERRRYAEEVAALYAAYRARLEALGRPDREGWAWLVLDGLRARPRSWKRRPVFFYGFDDLTAAQLDAVEALVRAAEAPVTLSLTHEPGRIAFAARAATVEVLKPLARSDGELVELPDRSDHYVPASRSALHHLERRLFEAGGERADAGSAVRLLEAGGERAEAELAGAEVLRLLADGMEPEEVAVLVRNDAGAALLEQVLEGYGVPVARQARSRLDATRLGAGVLAFARAALPGGDAADVLAWLRTPGKLADPSRADRLEARVRRSEARTATEARALWERGAHGRAVPADPPGPLGPALSELDALRAAAAVGAEALLDVLLAELDSIWTARHRRRGAALPPDAQEDARVAAAVRAACGELRAVAQADPRLAGSPAEVLGALAGLEIEPRSAPGGLVIADPLAVRARRFRAVLVCGLQDGTFPRRPAPDPFFDDAERRALARATGVVLPVHEDVLALERYAFYASVSRAREVLFLSFRSSDEEGEPQLRSPFVDDVRNLFTDELWHRRGRRLLAEVAWPAAQAPTSHELRRARAARGPRADPAPLAPPVSAAVLERLAAREREPARALESFAACGVRWLVESELRPSRVDADPDPLKRGALAHAVVERTLRGLRERTGSARLGPDTRAQAERELERALAELAPADAGARSRAALRALEVDLRRWLEQECAADTGMEPAHLEWSFGGDGDEHGPLELADGLRLSGRVDRIDVGPGKTAVVRDYKNSRAHPAAKWADERHLQAALYALAARDLLGLEPAGALYQPLAGRDLRPRGALRADVGAGPAVSTDVLAPAELDVLLGEVARVAAATARELRAGRVAPCPERCTTRGCAYPGICRAGDAATAVRPGYPA